MQTSFKLMSWVLAAAVVGCSSPLNVPEIKPVINYEPSVVTPVAGSVQGYWDGPAAEAKFLSMRGLAIDASGSIFVTDQGMVGPTLLYRIRKIDSAGNVSTIAGSSIGETNGPVAQARFSVPIGIAVAGDRLYISDSNNNRIRLITAESTASTLAGGVQGYADGPALEARFSMPNDLVVDRDGNIYVGEANSVRKISTAGTVSTLAGGASPIISSTPGASTGQLAVNPRGLGIDSLGNVLVASGLGIYKITPTGEVTKVAGASDNRMAYVDGPATEAHFQFAEDVAADQAGNLFVTDGFSVRRISSAGIVTTIAGGQGPDSAKQDEGEGSKVRFGHISSIAVDASGSLIVGHGARISRIRLN